MSASPTPCVCVLPLLPEREPSVPHKESVGTTGALRGKPAPSFRAFFRNRLGHELAKRGYQVTSLDLNKKFYPDICCDILKRDATVFPPGHFELITASPPCTEYSIAKTVGVRKLFHADELVKRTLALIQYFRPPTWWIENPRTGLLKSRLFMHTIPFVDVEYCQFGCWGIKKPHDFG